MNGDRINENMNELSKEWVNEWTNERVNEWSNCLKLPTTSSIKVELKWPDFEIFYACNRRKHFAKYIHRNLHYQSKKQLFFSVNPQAKPVKDRWVFFTAASSNTINRSYNQIYPCLALYTAVEKVLWVHYEKRTALQPSMFCKYSVTVISEKADFTMNKKIKLAS